MAELTLRDLVLKRLDADTKPEHEWSALALAALESPDELAKLPCLSDYLAEESLGKRVRHAWGALSDACHHHPYEFAPSAGELRGWIEAVSAFARQTQAPGAREPR